MIYDYVWQTTYSSILILLNLQNVIIIDIRNDTRNFTIIFKGKKEEEAV